jgi:hypothetical protein
MTRQSLSLLHDRQSLLQRPPLGQMKASAFFGPNGTPDRAKARRAATVIKRTRLRIVASFFEELCY